jgi:HAD superfamily hydrolase (TIGR01509 family)
LNVVWDFGGVLFQWRPALLLARMLPQRVTDDASAAHWQTLFFEAYAGDWGEFDRGTVEVDELVDRIVARTGLSNAEVRAVVDAIPAELEPIAASVALVHTLRERGHGVYFLSNMPLPYAEHLERSHAFVAQFDDGVFSSRVKLIKPEAAVFRLAQQRFGIDAADTVFIDDHLPNIVAARRQGWQALHFTEPAIVEAELRALKLI